MNKQHPLRRAYREYKNLIVYGLVGINIFGMIVAVRVYINYRAIQASIAKVEAEKTMLLEKDWYAKNFQIYYLNSEYAPYFLAHENNWILPGEKLVKIETKKVKKIGRLESELEPRQTEEATPQDAWKDFIKESFSKNRF